VGNQRTKFYFPFSIHTDYAYKLPLVVFIVTVVLMNIKCTCMRKMVVHSNLVYIRDLRTPHFARVSCLPLVIKS